jgi:hypothetical protein
VDTEELEALNPLHYSPIDVDGGVIAPPFNLDHDQLLCLADVKGKVVVLPPDCQVSDLLPLGCLIVAGGQSYHRRAIGKINDAGVVCGNAVLVEQGVQVATKDTPLRGARVDGQCGRCVVA